jgi:hypothetical protein
VNALEIGKAAMEEILADGPELIGRFAEMVEQRKGEIDNLQALDDRADSVGLSRAEIAARMTAFYAG